jgi:Domain of unknown function (DUF4397)
MKILIATPLVLGATLIALAPAYASTAAYASSNAPRATSDGWVRLANLSPGARICDLYLYSFGNPQALTVLPNVSYGRVSAYSALPAGDYTVAMRLSGQSATAPAVASTVLMVMGNMQYTVAAMGTGVHEQFQTIDDSNEVPTGKTAVRILQAANGTTVTADVGQQQVGSDLKFGDITHYQTVTPGNQLVSVSTSNGQASADIPLSPNSTHTLVVLNGSNGPQISELTDAVGAVTPPSGGAATGFGGTAPRPASSAIPWLAMIAGGALAAALGRRRHGSSAATLTASR